MKTKAKFIILLLVFMILKLDNVKAYNLVFEAEPEEGNEKLKPCTITLIAGAYTGERNHDWQPDSYSSELNTYTYSTKAVQFYEYNGMYTNLGTNYYRYDPGNAVKVSYLSMPNGISTLTSANIEKAAFGKENYAYIKKNDGTQLPSVISQIPATAYVYKSKVVQPTEYFQWRFSSQHLMQIYNEVLGGGSPASKVEKYSDLTPTAKDKLKSSQKLRFSTIGETAKTSYPGYKAEKGNNNYNKFMDTAWKFYAVTYPRDVGEADNDINNHNWLPRNRGCYDDAVNVCNQGRYNADYVGTAIDSTVNEYDNIIVFPKLIQNDTQIYVRHVEVDEDGNVIRTLPDILTSGTTQSSKSTYSGVDYTEHYSIDSDKTVTYNGQYLTSGDKVYEFVSSKSVKKANESDAFKEIQKSTGRVSNNSYTVKIGDTTEYAFVEFYYKEVPTYEKDYPVNTKAGAYTTLSLKGLITNGNSNITVDPPITSSNTFCTTGDGDEDKSVLYVPASEKVKLNVEAQKFFYRHITQKPYVLNKQLKWKLIVEMYVLKDNTMRAKNSDESGTAFFGNTNNNVVSASSPYTLKDTPPFKIDDTLNDARTYINKNLEKYVGSTNFKIDSLQQLTKKSAGTKTAESDYLDIASTRYNGIRVVSGDSSYKKYVFTITKDDKSVNTNNTVDNNSDVTLDTNSTRINLYTPLVVENVKIKAEGDTIINHSDSKDVTQIQKGSKFTINPTDDSSSGYPGAIANIDTSKYAKEYKLVFDFDVNDKPAGTVFPVGRGQIFEGTVTGDIFQQNNSFKIMGVTINEPTIQEYVSKTQQVFDDEMKSTDMSSSLSKTSIEQTTTKYQYKKYIDKGRIGQIGVNSNACGQNTYLNFDNITDLKEGSFYRVVYKKQTINIGRIYGFRVTDCSDINWKDVFRTSEDGSVNGITGTIYFSGNKVYDYLSNQMTNATDLNGKTYIIPLGAYKHTNKTYIQAPKLGYRISFDLKTSGYYDYQKEAANAKRYIKITPSYYFIRKDGTGYTEDIKLYYKNSSGKYSQISSSNYSISFIPKDGYRHIYDNNTSYQFNTDIMSDKLRNIAVSQAFELISGNGGNNKGMMAIDNSNNDSVQVWFGEYKLPNSTIAVKQEDGKYNINNPLNDGYIGVKFDIQCIDEQSTGTVTLSYNKNNQSSTAPNTTQWDYDQYLGYTGLGREFSGDIPIQLEKGVWHINSQAEWNKIRGTVILYDADNRAANDFE